jgi:hypothetical protein
VARKIEHIIRKNEAASELEPIHFGQIHNLEIFMLLKYITLNVCATLK